MFVLSAEGAPCVPGPGYFFETGQSTSLRSSFRYIPVRLMFFNLGANFCTLPAQVSFIA